MDLKNVKLTDEQIKALKDLAEAVQENKEILNKDNWKRSSIKWSYVVSAIPVVWEVGSAFGLNVHLSATQATYLLQFVLFAFPLIHSFILAVTSKKISLNPIKVFQKIKRDVDELI